MVAVESLADAPPGHYLLHCRPRLMFHLGHVRMLNVLYELLQAGNSVTILILTYDEHETRNRTYRSRLEEEVSLTRDFYRRYLGYEAPHLRIESSAEMALNEGDLRAIQAVYQRLYDQGSPAIRRLIDEQNRAWASPNILFVPKCIAAVSALQPDYLVAGRKHSVIAEAFDEILKGLGIETPHFEYSDFLDLLMATPMDRADSVHTYIDVNDNDDFVLHKLAMLRSSADTKMKWLDHFATDILQDAPERVKSDVSRVTRSEAEKEIALVKFLANVRQLIPYAIEDERQDSPTIEWSMDLSSTFTQSDRVRIERIARALYKGLNCDSITFPRIYSGASGSIVLEAREHISGDRGQVSNISVLKIGPELEIQREHRLYERLVAPRKTAAFMGIRTGGATVQGASGIAYQDVSQYLGLSAGERIENVATLMQRSQFRRETVQEQLGILIRGHLNEVLYKHARRVESGPIRRYLGEFLPSEVRVSVNEWDGRANVARGGAYEGVRETLSAEIEVTEVNLKGGQVRAYTCLDHKKLDIILQSPTDEKLLNEFTNGSRIFIDAPVIARRSELYHAALQRLGGNRSGSRYDFTQGVKISDPVEIIESIMAREYSHWALGPVHGDLHAGNALYSAGRFGLIDYGKMRDEFPVLYDIAFLLADLKVVYMSARYSLEEIRALEDGLCSGFGWLTRPRGVRDLQVFEYASLSGVISSYGGPELYFALLAGIYLGRLKFDLSEHEKRVCLVLAHYAWKRSQP